MMMVVVWLSRINAPYKPRIPKLSEQHNSLEMSLSACGHTIHQGEFKSRSMGSVPEPCFRALTTRLADLIILQIEEISADPPKLPRLLHRPVIPVMLLIGFEGRVSHVVG